MQNTEITRHYYAFMDSPRPTGETIHVKCIHTLGAVPVVSIQRFIHTQRCSKIHATPDKNLFVRVMVKGLSGVCGDIAHCF